MIFSAKMYMKKDYYLKQFMDYNRDYCTRYFPRFSANAFFQELSHTQDQLIEYFPSNVKQSYNQLQRTQRNTSIAFWTIDLIVVATCHRIRIISRIFSNKWAMFIFKSSLVAVPYYVMEMMDAEVNKQFNSSFYKMVKKQYMKYKRNGDIRDLNPCIQIIDEFNSQKYGQSQGRSQQIL